MKRTVIDGLFIKYCSSAQCTSEQQVNRDSCVRRWKWLLMYNAVFTTVSYTYRLLLLSSIVTVKRSAMSYTFNPLWARKNRRTADHHTAIQWLVHWPLMGGRGLLHLVQQGGAWADCSPAQSPPYCIKCNSPPINGQCTSFIIIWCGTIIASVL